MEEQTMPNLDIKDFQSRSAVEKLDNILMVLSGGTGAKITVDLLLKILLKDIQPSVTDDGELAFGGVSTGVLVTGKSPFLQTSENGIEWKYEGETSLRPLVSYEQLKLKFSDLTPEQFQSLKLTLADLTAEEIAELQKPATETIESVKKVGEDATAAEKLRVEAEGKRTSAETVRDTKEKERILGDEGRVTAEEKRVADETTRTKSETSRISKEKERVSAEDKRIASETTRGTKEGERITAESGRVTAETARVSAEEKRVEEFGILKTDSKNAISIANEVASHPNIIGEDKYWYKWNEVTKEYDKTEYYSKGSDGDSGVYYGDNPPLDGSVKVVIDPSGTYQGSSLTPLFVARGAVFNSKTGYYELNGLTDITETEMLNIYNYTSQTPVNQDWTRMFYDLPNGRTNFPPKSAIYTPDMTATFASSPFSVIQVSKNPNVAITPTNVMNAFYQSSKLIRVIGIIDLSNISSTGYFLRDVRTLAEITLKNIKVSISIADSPNLTRDSILYLINNAANTTVITLTLHQTAKARLIPEDIALASSKNITIA